MFYIFAIVPFGLSYKQKGWHLVLFNNWFKIQDLHKYWQTSFTYLSEEKMFPVLSPRIFQPELF